MEAAGDLARLKARAKANGGHGNGRPTFYFDKSNSDFVVQRCL
jgi:hypothetical protein